MEIMDRWSVERDTWVSHPEVEQARAYLDHQGIATTALPDGHYRWERTGETVDAAHLVLRSLNAFLGRTGRLPPLPLRR